MWGTPWRWVPSFLSLTYPGLCWTGSVLHRPSLELSRSWEGQLTASLLSLLSVYICIIPFIKCVSTSAILYAEVDIHIVCRVMLRASGASYQSPCVCLCFASVDTFDLRQVGNPPKYSTLHNLSTSYHIMFSRTANMHPFARKYK